MRVDLRYRATSGVRELPTGPILALEPNLARPKVFFDAELSNPTRFREAICALHEIVVGDLKFKKKDKASYLAYLQEQAQKEAELKQALFDQAKRSEAARIVSEPVPEGLDAEFHRMHRLYWGARREWATDLSQADPELFRQLVPCDPVVTVAPDVLLFECFSKDESSYACLSVDRGTFRSATQVGLGTTNVDYSLGLYEHFQTLRSYRNTRLLVDPSGFEVKTEEQAPCREEQIDLPSSWLRGFGQLQAAMALPGRTVWLSPDVLYSILAHLKRNREKSGPRTIRFELRPGEQPVVHLDPWGVSIQSSSKRYDGPAVEVVKVWGRRRLFALARLLPMVSDIEVSLLGSGLPSVWIAHMGDMRFTLALSGWTAIDWTQGSSLDQHFGAFRSDEVTVETLARFLETNRRATPSELCAQVEVPEKTVLGSLHTLAKRGQVAYDHGAKAYRWRPILPVALSESVLGPEHPELIEGRTLSLEVNCTRDEAVEGGKRLLVAKVQNTSCEGLMDADGVFGRARCSCSYFHRNRLRAGPCRHLIALRMHARGLLASETSPQANVQVVAADASGRPDMANAKNKAPDETMPILQRSADASSHTPASSERDAPNVDKEPTSNAPRVGATDLHLTDAIWGEVQEEAERRNVSPSEVVERAWRIARVRVGQALSDDLGAASSQSGGSTRASRHIELRADTDTEMFAQAARLEVDPSTLFEFAWSLARVPMRITSSVLDSSQ